MATQDDVADFIIAPDPAAPRLTRTVQGVDHNGETTQIAVVEERPLTIFLNSHLLQEIELICEQVAILSNGTVRKTGSVKELTAAISESPLLLQVAGPAATVKQLLPEAIDRSNGVFDVELSLPSQAEVDRTIDELRAAGISIVSMRRRSQTLEEAFLEIVSNEEDAA